MSSIPASSARSYTAVIMGGRRAGVIDPVASLAGTSHKCLAPVAGTPMLLRVLEALEKSKTVGRIVLCVDKEFDPPAFVQRRLVDGRLESLAAAGSPAASALRACKELNEQFPILVITADHALVDPTIIDYFCTHAVASADIVVGIAHADVVLDAYPDSSRTLLRFADGPFCGCNLFALNRSEARHAAAYWRTMETQRKRPWRLVRMIGLRSLLSYMTGRLSLSLALQRLSAKIGITADKVVLPFAEAAIDVDKVADLELVERILTRRASIEKMTDHENP